MMTKRELMKMLRNARTVPDSAEVVLVVDGSSEVIHFDEKRVLFLTDQFGAGADLKALYVELRREVDNHKAKLAIAPEIREAKDWLAGGDDKARVPCGNPDSACGLRGGTASCVGCRG